MAGYYKKVPRYKPPKSVPQKTSIVWYGDRKLKEIVDKALKGVIEGPKKP